MWTRSAHVATIVVSVAGVGSVVAVVGGVVVFVGNVGGMAVAVAKREFVLLQTLDKPFHIG